MSECVLCHRWSDRISRSLGLCSGCILADTVAARAQAAAAHATARGEYGLPAHPPRAKDGARCRRCVNACSIARGQFGYCGVRTADGGQVIGGDAHSGVLQWYYDPLPTNCVAEWVCPASTGAGYPHYTDTQGPEQGYHNLAVFYEACSFDCFFCQNWHFRERTLTGPRHSASELAAAVTDTTRCICFFGGDPSCQAEHALAAAGAARQRRKGGILRICWETNGSVSPALLEEMLKVSLESGGCIKFDLKAWDDSLHRALCGVSNRRTLANFELASRWAARRPDPPLVVASTLLVPGYIDAHQVGRVAAFIAGLDPGIPYTLLGFHPDFEMNDLPKTSRLHATECLDAAKKAGLERVRVGNVHLLT
ncbi:MAG TPA: radical SAM protein [Phycisphaerae bacterium]|nr:radical SAM protein [Phycisphaerae bacterium]